MEVYIKKRTLYAFFVVLLLLAVSMTVMATQRQQHIKQYAATQYPEPPMYGCLQIGEGTNKSCASKLLNTELHVSLKGFDIKGGKVFYNETLEATLTISNPGDLPLKVRKLAVTGHALAASYKVDFKPLKENFTINPGETVTLTGAKHTFNNPDPGGPWEIVSLMVDDNGQSVSDVQRVDLAVDTTCKALLRVPLNDGEISALQTTCTQNRSGSAGGVACDDFCKIFPDKCGGSTQPQSGQQSP